MIVAPEGRAISDNIDNYIIGHNFRWFSSHKDVLVKSILQDDKLAKQFVESLDNGLIRWNQGEVM